MKIKLAELEDLQWFPSSLRNQQLQYIGWLVSWLNLYKPVPHALSNWALQSENNRLFDLCSGSGEPIVSLQPQLQHISEVKLSDKYPPSLESNASQISYLKESVDVLSLSFKQDYLYTMFNAFHHFDDSEQQAIIQGIVESEAPFFFVEILQPGLLAILKVLLANTIGQLLLAPFVKPFSWSRMVMTYIIPINLITTTYDGIISVLKSKNKKAYKTLLEGIGASRYQIEVLQMNAPFFNQLTIIRGKSAQPSI